MNNMYYFEVPFTCKCEECGNLFSGTIKRGPLQIGSSVLSTGMQVGMNSVEMRFSKRLIEGDLENGTTKYFTASLYTCPSCGARQSWMPMVKPKKPSYIGLYIAGIIGFSLLALLIWAIFFFDNPIIFAILMSLAIFFGIFLPYRSQKKNKTEERRVYEEDCEKYLKYVAEIKNRKVHNKPQINWNEAKHIPVKY